MRFLAAAAIALAFLAAAASADGDDSQARALLAKHRAFVGWQLGDGTFSSLQTVRETLDARGRVTSTILQRRVGLIYRNTQSDPGGLQHDWGFTGRVVWNCNENGFTTPIFGPYERFAMSVDVLFAEGTNDLPAQFRGDATIDGRLSGVVRVSVPDGVPVDLAIDASTGAYVDAVVDPEGPYRTTYRFLAYAQPIPGKKIVSSYRVDGEPERAVVTKIEANVPIGDAQLHPPAPRATWRFATIPVPLSIVGNRAYVAVAVNGVAGRFVLDSGSGSIVLNQSFAARANVHSLGVKKNSIGIGGNTAGNVVRIAHLDVGGNRLSNAVAYTVDFNAEDYRGLDDANVDGLLGFDLFAGAIVRLDPSAGSMTLLDPATDLSHEAGTALTTQLGGGIPTVDALLDGGTLVEATLDTGNPRYVLYGERFARASRLAIAPQENVVMQGENGTESDRCGTLGNLTLGPVTYHAVIACESPTYQGAGLLIGFDLLEQLRMTFDYPHGRIYVSR